MAKVLGAVLLTVLPGAWMAAQGHPEFSGRWVLESPDRPPSSAPRSMLVRQALVSTTVRGGSAPRPSDITIEREAGGLTHSETFRIGLQSGVVPGIRAGGTAGGARTRQSVRWDGMTVVFESSRSDAQVEGPRGWAERREVWSLDAKDRLRVVITTRSSGGAQESVTLVYRRQ